MLTLEVWFVDLRLRAPGAPGGFTPTAGIRSSPAAADTGGFSHAQQLPVFADLRNQQTAALASFTPFATNGC
jgi:hypothetical protein